MEKERNILQYIKDWVIVKQKWRITSTYRKKIFQNGIAQAFDLWPLYSDERIAELVR